jgi:hypothetical protein
MNASPGWRRSLARVVLELPHPQWVVQVKALGDELSATRAACIRLSAILTGVARDAR